MNNHHTHNYLTDLRLLGMAEQFSRYLENPQLMPESAIDFFTTMVDAEVHDRKHRRQVREEKKAKLKFRNACLEDFDFSVDRGINRQLIAWISGFSWLQKKQNLIITGLTGTGKTYLACAIANNAIRQGYTALYKRIPRLIEEMEISRGAGSLPSDRAKMQKPNLFVLDEWAVSPLNARARLDLLEVIEDRTGTGSLIITSQLPVEKWHEFIGEPTLADALLDRVVHRSHRLELEGDSMRRIKESVGEKNYV
ncbi:MAG: IS21-like element helper ATPase IstB [Agarilytica sp.]